MRTGIIGQGAIGRYVLGELVARGFSVGAVLVRPGRETVYAAHCQGIPCVSSLDDLPEDIDHMIDCAGHAALRAHGPAILRRGLELTTVSIGALADAQLSAALERAAMDGGARLHLASGAIGALDCLRAAAVGELTRVIYRGRKPPLGWRGSPAEQTLDLDNLAGKARVHFSGNAREAALQYPKNANVAAAVALAGVGFERTQVQLIADPAVSQNVHELTAEGAFGAFRFSLEGVALAENPRSSALAAMSVVSRLQQQSRRVGF